MIVPEHIAKAILARYAVPHPRGAVIGRADQVAAIVGQMGGAGVVKALIPAGGRGRVGGVMICRSVDEATQAAERLLGSNLLGHRVRHVLIEEVVPVARELYVAVTLNCAENTVDVLISQIGGVNIEQLARRNRTSVYRLAVEPGDVLPVHRLERWLAPLGGNGIDTPSLALTLASLYRAAADVDALLMEVNPLAVRADGALVALDCKLEVDDNALVRQPLLLDQYERSLDAREARARRLGVSYVPLDGEVAIVASGAGLGMVTMDLLVRAGLRPACFLDTGGAISESLVKGALELVMEPLQVHAAIINLYGGINRMSEAAKGIVSALEVANRPMPLVVKILGNQQEEAWTLLENRSDVHIVRTAETEAAVSVLAARLRDDR